MDRRWDGLDGTMRPPPDAILLFQARNFAEEAVRSWGVVIVWYLNE